MHVVDDALSAAELARWRALAIERSGGESQRLAPEDYEGTELFALVQRYAPGALIHVLLFEIADGCETTRHRDVGEWAACFYPVDCPTGPLWTEAGDVAVRANRLVMFDATTLEHQQVTPTDGSARRSVVFKFRRPI